jgi:predicted cupin superfamily sugar epimerase
VKKLVPQGHEGNIWSMNAASDASAREIIAKLGLIRHPEGGFYAETFRSPDRVTLADGRERSSCTAIYYLLLAGSFSALHRVAADEIWHHYGGSPLELVTISPDGASASVKLGPDLAGGQRPQAVVPSGVWQGARPMCDGRSQYSLVGCTVSPGFEFEDFEMPDRASLLELFPRHEELVILFTRA